MALAHAAGQHVPSFVMPASAVRAGRGYQPAVPAPTLAASARAAAERIRGRMQLAAESIIEVGRELIQQKKDLGHGNFLPWIEAEFQWSQPTAHRYMSVAETFGRDYSRVNNLSFKAMIALSSDATPEPVRTEVLERAASGERATSNVSS